VHDRHDGNKEAARQYLAWEVNLIGQLDALELKAFHCPDAAAAHTPPEPRGPGDPTFFFPHCFCRSIHSGAPMFAKLKLTAASLCCALLTAHGTASAQPMPQVGGFPNQAIKFVSPFPAGGGNDAHDAFVTTRLSDITGQSAIVDNRGGAGGNIGAKAVADAKPDGYTVLTGQVSLMAVNPTLYASPGFDPLKNFLPITQINAAPLVLVVPSNSPLKSFADLAAQTKAPGGRVTYATPGNGTLSHLVGVVLEKDSAISMTHVPYKGAAPPSPTCWAARWTCSSPPPPRCPASSRTARCAHWPSPARAASACSPSADAGRAGLQEHHL
jgi:tripartite-type tricarboxylate transporter receptor subunit TctC